MRRLANFAFSVFACTGILAMTTGCATAPDHPAVAKAVQSGTLPDLIPARRFFANRKYNAAFLLAPDGKHVLWSTVVGTDSGLAVAAVDTLPATADAPTPPEAKHRFATGFRARPIGGSNFGWLADSRHAWFIKDLKGAENTQVWIFDTQSGSFKPWNATPWPGTRSYLINDGVTATGTPLMVSNRRDKSVFDVYEISIADKKARLIEQNNGSVKRWYPDIHGRIALRQRLSGSDDGSPRIIEVKNLPDNNWTEIFRFEHSDSWWPARIDLDKGQIIATSNIGRDKRALVNMSIESGEVQLVYEHPTVDIGSVWSMQSTLQPFGVLVHDGYPQFNFLDTPTKAPIQALMRQGEKQARSQGLISEPVIYSRPSTIASDRQRMIMRVYTATNRLELLVDAANARTVALTRPNEKDKEVLSPSTPFSFVASDGLTIHGYLTKPLGVSGPAPLIVAPHGGPWIRDAWDRARYGSREFLANRGYAILRVNYRGSSGYGRNFLTAGYRKAHTRLQLDISEAVQWAIDTGHADPDRLAVMGGSFGGFSTLMQLIDKHQPYRCGVNIVGVANWPRIFKSWPPFWRNRHMFKAFFGDVNNPEDEELLWASSPMSRIDRIVEPLLVIHGANDVRVVKQDSDDVVAALRKLGRPVQYLVFPNEGHSVRRWRNRLEQWRRIEKFFAACIGGRDGGFDLYQMVPR